MIKSYEFDDEEFPFLIELLDPSTGRTVWSVRVEGPGVLEVPTSSEIWDGGRLGIRMTYPDEILEMDVDGNLVNIYER